MWLLLQQKIDDVLEGIRLSDLLHEESEVRTLVGLSERARCRTSQSAGKHVLPVLGG